MVVLHDAKYFFLLRLASRVTKSKEVAMLSVELYDKSTDQLSTSDNIVIRPDPRAANP